MDPSIGNDLVVEVMQLSPPHLNMPIQIPTSRRSNSALVELNNIDNSESMSSMLLLPNKLVNTYLGEQFRICCSIRKAASLLESENRHIQNIKVSCQISNKNLRQPIVLYENTLDQISETTNSIDFIAEHDMQLADLHKLEINVNYSLLKTNIQSEF